MANKETLLAQAKEANIEVPEEATKAEIQALLDASKTNDESADSTEAEDSANDNNSEGDVDGVTSPEGTGETPAVDKTAENEDNAATTEAHLADAKEVETELGTSIEEKAAEEAGVSEERLNDPKQNREPKNEFEQENQKVTDEERQAAQKASNVSTKAKLENELTPAENAAPDAEATAATNHGSDIAAAIVQGLKESKSDNFTLQEEPGVEHRFSLVKSKDTGEVMIRENETGTLSKIQLLSLEEKENDVQKTEVEEI